MSYPKWEKIPRLFNETFQITEKIDGTNGLIYVAGYDDATPYKNEPHACAHDGEHCVWAGSRTRWITPDQDNHGFAQWVYENAGHLAELLGPGHHYGEWAGPGINKNRHGLEEKTFFLFNVRKWAELPPEFLPSNVRTVPVLDYGVDYASLYDCVQNALRLIPDTAEGVVVRSDLTGQNWKYFVGGVAANATTKGQVAA